MSQIEFSSIRMIPSGPVALPRNQAIAEFEELAMPLANSAYNLARWLARSDQDAEDLVQETYLRAFRNFSSFEPGTNFRAWIFRILRNTFLSSCSTLERRMTVQLDSDEESTFFYSTCATPEAYLIESFNIATIRGAIEQLPLRFREIILLRDVENVSYGEIAEILEIPVGTVMSRLSRARRTIRESLLCVFSN
jgi:RNA polymerase sigma-70 factor (ECF subfamily)